MRKIDRILLLSGLIQTMPSIIVGIAAILKANVVLSALAGIATAVGLFLILTILTKKDPIIACYPPIANFLILISCIAVNLCSAASEIILLTIVSFIVASIGFIIIVLREEILK